MTVNNRSCPRGEIGKVPQANKPKLDENLEIAARFGEPALTYYIENMITLIKRITLRLAVTTVLGFAATGCNTAHGFGRDMEAAGDKIQEGTD